MNNRPEESLGNEGSSNYSTVNSNSMKRGPVETSILDYVLCAHLSQLSSRASLIALLIHAELLARGARPSDNKEISSAVLDPSCFSSDPIRLSYTVISRPKSSALSTPCCQLQVSVTETDSHIFVSLTDTATDKFGHLELSGVEHVRLDSLSQIPLDVNNVFPQLMQLLVAIEQNLWKPVLPSPPLHRSLEADRKKEKTENRPDESVAQPQRIFPDVYPEPRPQPNVPFPDYGRSDLDPLGTGIGLPSRGGMLLDPRRLLGSGTASGGSFFGGPDVLPPGAVPPGARFDPFGPGVMPNRPNFGASRSRVPDPDHALPPGFEDIYM